MLNVAGVTRRSRLEDQNFSFLIRSGTMLDAMRNDDELTWVQFDHSVAKFDTKATPNAKEELVLPLMLMPHKGAAELHDFDFLPVELTNDLGAPVFGDERELLSEVYLVHGES